MFAAIASTAGSLRLRGATWPAFSLRAMSMISWIGMLAEVAGRQQVLVVGEREQVRGLERD